MVLFAEGELKSNLGSLHDRRIVAAILVAFVDQIKALTAVHIGMRDPAVEERHGAVVEGILVLVVNIAILAGESVLNKQILDKRGALGKSSQIEIFVGVSWADLESQRGFFALEI